MTLKVVDKWQKIQSVKYWLVVHFYVQKYLLYYINIINATLRKFLYMIVVMYYFEIVS